LQTFNHLQQIFSHFSTVFDANEKPTPQLSGMICFVSTSKQGFIYNVFRKTEFLAHCTYTSETTTAAICNNLLYSVTSQALETYVVPIYAAVAKHVRTMRSSDVEDTLYIDQAMVQSNDTTEVHGEVLSTADGSSTHNEESSQENKFTHFGFPVYDLEILQKVTNQEIARIHYHVFE
jgi:hypothetical protein